MIRSNRIMIKSKRTIIRSKRTIKSDIKQSHGDMVTILMIAALIVTKSCKMRVFSFT